MKNKRPYKKLKVDKPKTIKTPPTKRSKFESKILTSKKPKGTENIGLRSKVKNISKKTWSAIIGSILFVSALATIYNALRYQSRSMICDTIELLGQQKEIEYCTSKTDPNRELLEAAIKRIEENNDIAMIADIRLRQYLRMIAHVETSGMPFDIDERVSAVTKGINIESTEGIIALTMIENGQFFDAAEIILARADKESNKLATKNNSISAQYLSAAELYSNSAPFKSILAYNKANSLNPLNENNMYLLANTYYKVGDYDEAIVLLKKLLDSTNNLEIELRTKLLLYRLLQGTGRQAELSYGLKGISHYVSKYPEIAIPAKLELVYSNYRKSKDTYGQLNFSELADEVEVLFDKMDDIQKSQVIIYYLRFAMNLRSAKDTRLFLEKYEGWIKKYGSKDTLANYYIVESRVLAINDLAASKAKIQDALNLSKETGNEFAIAQNLRLLGESEYMLSNFKTAKSYYLEAQGFALRSNSIGMQAALVENLGLVALASGNIDEARENFQTSRELFNRINALVDVARQSDRIAVSLAMQYKLKEATAEATNAYELLKNKPTSNSFISTLANLISLSSQIGRSEDAQKFYDELINNPRKGLNGIIGNLGIGEEMRRRREFKLAKHHFNDALNQATDAKFPYGQNAAKIALAKLELEQTGSLNEGDYDEILSISANDNFSSLRVEALSVLATQNLLDAEYDNVREKINSHYLITGSIDPSLFLLGQLASEKGIDTPQSNDGFNFYTWVIEQEAYGVAKDYLYLVEILAERKTDDFVKKKCVNARKDRSRKDYLLSCIEHLQ